VSSDIAVLLNDWLEEAKRPQSSIGRGEFPVGKIDVAVDLYMKELNVVETPETKAIYEGVKRGLRRNWWSWVKRHDVIRWSVDVGM
jgi:nuclear pore complex protein Nup155